MIMPALALLLEEADDVAVAAQPAVLAKVADRGGEEHDQLTHSLELHRQLTVGRRGRCSGEAVQLRWHHRRGEGLEEVERHADGALGGGCCGGGVGVE